MSAKALSAPVPLPPPAPSFLDRLTTALQIRGRPPEVVQAQVGWVRQFILFHQKRHPELMGEAEIGAFLTHLAVDRCLPVGQQDQARQALLFLYREFLYRELGAIPVTYLRPPVAPEANGAREEKGT